MSREVRLLLPAMTVAAYSLVMFTAAGFFYSNYAELMARCASVAPRGCVYNESFAVSSISLQIGAVVFFLIGTFAWIVASYLAVRWMRHLSVGKLP